MRFRDTINDTPPATGWGIIDCPTCDAGPGEWCNGWTVTDRRRPHGARRDLADEYRRDGY